MKEIRHLKTIKIKNISTQNFNTNKMQIQPFCIHMRKCFYINNKNALGHMSQTGPKKCFIPQNCRKYTNFDWTEHSS